MIKTENSKKMQNTNSVTKALTKSDLHNRDVVMGKASVKEKKQQKNKYNI